MENVSTESPENTEEFLMQDVLKEEGGKGNHFEIPPADFLSDVDCAKKRRLALFDTPASKKCHQEKENVSCLVTGEESIKLVRERSSAQCAFCKVYFSAQPNKLRPILKFRKYFPVEHIFVPACSSVRKIHFFKF